MSRHGLPAEARVLPAPRVQNRGRKERVAVTEVAGAAAAERLLAGRDLPTALVTCNDRVTVGILLTLRSRGVRVPQPCRSSVTTTPGSRAWARPR
jgi:DNA-binding LacI/PurR family transcriptional regulator